MIQRDAGKVRAARGVPDMDTTVGKNSPVSGPPRSEADIVITKNNVKAIQYSSVNGGACCSTR